MDRNPLLKLAEHDLLQNCLRCLPVRDLKGVLQCLHVTSIKFIEYLVVLEVERWRGGSIPLGGSNRP